MAYDVGVISVLAELERIGWTYEPLGDEEVRVRCPAHLDDTPSASISVKSRLWKCHAAGCGASGDFVTFMAAALKTTRRVIWEELKTRYEFDLDKTLDIQVVERWHTQIWNAGPLLQALRDRGLVDADLRQYRLGFHQGRITIPIFNSQGAVVNVRKYLPGAPGKDKMRNTRGRSKPRLYPIEQLQFDNIVVTGGEMKAVVTARHLNPMGWGAITGTAGEGNWDEAFTPLFAGKHIAVIMDVDEGGIAASELVAARLRIVAASCKVVTLPLDIDRYPKGDLNDYFGPEAQTGDALLSVIDATALWEPRSVIELDDSEVEELEVADALLADNARRLIKITGTIQAVDTTPYLLPRTIACECDRNQTFCAVCPVYAQPTHEDKFVELTIRADAPAIAEMANAGKSTQRDAIREGLRIPPCKTVAFHVRDHWNFQQAHIAPQLQITAHRRDDVLVPALVQSGTLELNATYTFEGRTWPHPRSQQAVFLVSRVMQTDDALTTYDPDDASLDRLTFFRPSAWTYDALHERLQLAYRDLAANVTRIYERTDLHLAVDLAFHSVLVMPFDGRHANGWAQVLIVGDSSQGKTETTARMSEHYGLGGKVECKNASAAGLIGGLQQYGNKWLVTRGVIPAHDRQLVVLEELKGLPIEAIARMTDMRSSGVAEIDKIEKRKMFARTRLLAVSNPRSSGPVASYAYGIDSVRELIGNPEDVRRFDYALVLSNSQVDVTILNRLAREREPVSHTHTPNLCQACVLWAWTRRPEQVMFEEAAVDACLAAASRLCDKYVEAIPLVDRGSMRFKLARLAAALAARTFSTLDSDQRVLLVRRCHVEYIAAFIDRTYADPVFGYLDFSEAYRSATQLVDVPGIQRKLCATPYPRDIIEQFLHADLLELRDICDWCAWDRAEAAQLLSFLVRKHALVRERKGYRKNAAFITVLKALLVSDQLRVSDRPDHVEEDF